MGGFSLEVVSVRTLLEAFCVVSRAEAPLTCSFLSVCYVVRVVPWFLSLFGSLVSIGDRVTLICCCVFCLSSLSLSSTLATCV